MTALRSVVVVHVLGSLRRGGTEVRLLETVEATKVSDPPIEFHFVLLSGEGGSLEDRARDLGVVLHFLRLDWRFPVRFISVLRKFRADCVHSHVHFATGPILAVAFLARIKRRIAHFRSTGDGVELTRIRRVRNAAFKMLVSVFATDVLAGTDSVMTEVWGETWQRDPRCAVVGQGVWAQRFFDAVRNADPDRPLVPTLLQVGRIDCEKNQLQTLEVFALARCSRPEARLVLVGRETQPYATRVRRRAESLDLVGSVDFLGERSDIAELMADAAVIVHPTLREGWPGIVVEARAAGVPVVASDIPPIREVALGLSGVHLVGLDQPIESWASVVTDLLDAPMTRLRQIESAALILGSSYDAPVAARALAEYWYKR
jgi:glycosyltransferase involved in cell wall biosynthesis